MNGTYWAKTPNRQYDLNLTRFVDSYSPVIVFGEAVVDSSSQRRWKLYLKMKRNLLRIHSSSKKLDCVPPVPTESLDI